MNVCMHMGRLTRDPELKKTTSNIPVCEVTIAVNRKFDDDADFLNFVFWRKQAELVVQYLKKGSRILVQSHSVSESYETDNGMRYVTKFHVDSFDFIDSKQAEPKEEEELSPHDFMTEQPVVGTSEEDLPF